MGILRWRGRFCHWNIWQALVFICNFAVGKSKTCGLFPTLSSVEIGKSDLDNIGVCVGRKVEIMNYELYTMNYTFADKLMWHFMQGRCFRVLREECPKWDISQLRKEAKKRYREIVNATPSIGSYRDNSLKKNLTGGMVWIAIYETAKERYGEKMSIVLYEKMCRYSIANPMMLKMARLSKPFTRKFQEGIMKRSERENRIDSSYNWQAHYKQGKVDEEFTLYYTRCGLCQLARERGHLDILPAMCLTDYIVFEAMGVILHRDKTLASGDDCCHYYMTKPGSEAERRWQEEHPEGMRVV